nr:ACT domain-containing protein [bacterium]
MSDTPSSSSGPARWVISLLAPDRIGILKALTSAVSDLSGNIDGMSQTVIHGYFTVILTVTFDNSSSQEQIREAV